jgi:multidrug transporter EmrE-like cation transporter
MLFCGMQCVANLLFKWGSTSDSRWIWGFCGGHLFGVSSLWILMVLYKTMNPNVAFGICFGGMFLVSQIAIAVVFKSGISMVQYAGITSITVGILLLVAGRTGAT